MEIRKITLIGANGTVGSQLAGIFASFGEAKVYMVSRTIEKSISAIEKAVNSVRADSIRSLLIPKTYDDLVECVKDSDLVFESVAEDFYIKSAIFKEIDKYIQSGTVIATGTSGLSINKLAEFLSKEHRSLFFGVHFFNPPYSLPFLEFTRTKESDDRIADEVFQWCKDKLLRKAIRTKDKAAFLGNRIGFLFFNEVAQFADLYKSRGGVDYMDSILGPFTGRAMAPLATVDFVGLDIHCAIISNIHEYEPDFFSSEQSVPEYISHLTSNGYLGKKSGCGLYKTNVSELGLKQRQVYDIETASYRPIKHYDFEFARKAVDFIANGEYVQAINAIINDDSEEAQICTYFLIKYIVLSYMSAVAVSENIADADIAMSYGFNWVPPSSLLSLMGGGMWLKAKIISDVRLRESLRDFDFSLFDQEIRKTDIDYRRYFRALL